MSDIEGEKIFSKDVNVIFKDFNQRFVTVGLLFIFY